MRRRLLLFAPLLLIALTAAPGFAQETDSPSEPIDCGTYEGVVCDGWFTDDASVVDDDQRVDDAIDRVVGRYGVQIALVIVNDTGGQSTESFADNIGNAWGVGDADRNDGIVTVVNLSARETWVTTGPGISIDDSRAAGAGNSFFGGGDYEGGALAIVGSLEQEIAAFFGEPDDLEPVSGVDVPAPADDGPSGWTTLAALGVAAGIGGGVGLRQARKKRHDRIRRAREAAVDDELEHLEPAGHELPRIDDFQATFEGGAPPTSTGEALTVLRAIHDGRATADVSVLQSLWAEGLIVMVDRDRLLAETAMPLELRVSGERALLESAVQQAARDALAVAYDKDPEFTIARDELHRLVASLRPHRVAAARARVAETIASRLVPTEIGTVLLEDEGLRMLQAGPVLESDVPLAQSIGELAAAYQTASEKTERLETMYGKLPASTTRPAVAAALADLDTDLDQAYKDYEKVRRRLTKEGSALEADGLDTPAIAALLVMNNDDADVTEFVDTYRTIRNRGFEPDEAVEYALAGLRERGEIELVRTEAEALGLPVSIMTALLRRRDDGPEVYRALLDELADEGVTADTRRTIAGILAVSLEPSQSMRRWLDARRALLALGLQGAYADVAAAFGASDPRGPRVFALSYAATRQALERSSIDDADRFAPELAHDGTKRREDSWTGEPIPRGLYTYDPYTLLFYHWIITKGHHGSYGWEPIYKDASWGGDRGSWWSGTGGFSGWGGGGGFGGGGGGSSWGGGFGGGGFGGFSGGGGFGGGGGSSW